MSCESSYDADFEGGKNTPGMSPPSSCPCDVCMDHPCYCSS